MDKRTPGFCSAIPRRTIELDADVLPNPKSGRRYPIRDRIPIFFASALEDSPAFLPDGDLLFRAIEGETNFLYRMHADGRRTAAGPLCRPLTRMRHTPMPC
jgi:uncharacterized protein YbaR (Trm112 family)